TYKEIEQELNNAKVRFNEAKKNLKTFEKEENDGKWLKKLRRKLDNKE
ncbi:15050_t:CDS:1, partial [Funneliformis caledonium]